MHGRLVLPPSPEDDWRCSRVSISATAALVPLRSGLFSRGYGPDGSRAGVIRSGRSAISATILRGGLSAKRRKAARPFGFSATSGADPATTKSSF